MGTFQLPLAGFLGALHSLGEKDMDVDEVQCILANLIDKVMVMCNSMQQVWCLLCGCCSAGIHSRLHLPSTSETGS